jgi:PAS domain S-box-containing protein
MTERISDDLMATDRHLQRVLDATNIIVWEADPQTWQFTYVSSKAERILGYPLDQWYEKDFWTSNICPEDREFAINFCENSSKTLSDFEFEYRMVKADGDVIWLRDIVNVEIEDGVPQVLRGYMIDITAIKELEQTLRNDCDQLAESLEKQSEKLKDTTQRSEQSQISLRTSEVAKISAIRDMQKLRDFLDAAPDAMVIADESGVIVFASAQLERVFGYRPQEVVGADMEILLPKRFRRRHHAHFVKFFQNPQTREMGFGLELSALRKDGSEFPVEISLNPVRTENHLMISSAIRDITTRKALQLSAEKGAELEYLYAVAPIGLCYFDKDLRFLYVNEWLARINGLSVQAHLGKKIQEVLKDVAADTVAQLRQVLETGEPIIDGTVEAETPAHPGESRHYMHNYYADESKDGTVVGVSCVVQDITERKRAEEVVRKTHERLETRVQDRTQELRAVNEVLSAQEKELRKDAENLHKLTARLIVAQEDERRRIGRELHDGLTQNLAAIAIDAGRLEQVAEATEGRDKDGLHKIKEDLMELSENVHSLSRQLHPAIVEDLGITFALQSLCEEIQQIEGVQIDFEADAIPADVPNGHALCIYRVVQEALRNIVKHARATQTQVHLHSENGTLQFQVRDNGIGFILDEAKNQIGLGLRSIEERVWLVGGKVQVETGPGDGTTISVSIPLT